MSRKRATAAPRRDQAPASTRPSSRLIVLTGVSGSGKSQAIRALEDLGYFCVDNLPILLIPTFAELTLRATSEFPRSAVVVDVREGRMLGEFPVMYERLRRVPGLDPVLIFLDASDDALVRRFSETRRPHPLGRDESAIEGIAAEREHLAPIRAMADEIIDTTDMTVHELRQAFLSVGRGNEGPHGPVVTLLSFGFKHGLPVDADLVFDVRFLPNPHFVPGLREQTGRDEPVVNYLDQFEETTEFLDKVTALLRFLLPRYATEGKSYVTVAVGCTGGRHRSVALTEALRKALAENQALRLRVRHRDIAMD
jgi:RNase adapter protein RapZ